MLDTYVAPQKIVPMSS